MCTVPVLHAVGLPALRELQAADGRLAPGGDVVVGRIPVVVPTEPAHLVLQPLPHGDAQHVEAVVADLDVLDGVDDQEALGAGDPGLEPRHEGDRHRGPVHLPEPAASASPCLSLYTRYLLLHHCM